MRRALLAAPLIALAAGGCGASDDEATPLACQSGANAYLEALADAPAAVRLDGETAIGDCLVENQSAADIEQVGLTMLRVASDLNAAARKDPGGDPPLQLGYLIGAVQKGSEETGGIHAELARRLEAAALFSPAGKAPPPPFDQRYQEGFDAAGAQG
jgi:hypothetical protein